MNAVEGVALVTLKQSMGVQHAHRRGCCACRRKSSTFDFAIDTVPLRYVFVFYFFSQQISQKIRPVVESHILVSPITGPTRYKVPAVRLLLSMVNKYPTKAVLIVAPRHEVLS